MTNYDAKTYRIGYSDIAGVVIRSPHIVKVLQDNTEKEIPEGVAILNFGEDGVYKAHIIYKGTEFPDNFKLVYRCEYWLWLYDDEQRMLNISGRRINIYSSGRKAVIEIDDESHEKE